MCTYWMWDNGYVTMWWTSIKCGGVSARWGEHMSQTVYDYHSSVWCSWNYPHMMNYNIIVGNFCFDSLRSSIDPIICMAWVSTGRCDTITTPLLVSAWKIDEWFDSWTGFGMCCSVPAALDQTGGLWPQTTCKVPPCCLLYCWSTDWAGTPTAAGSGWFGCWIQSPAGHVDPGHWWEEVEGGKLVCEGLGCSYVTSQCVSVGVFVTVSLTMSGTRILYVTIKMLSKSCLSNLLLHICI